MKNDNSERYLKAERAVGSTEERFEHLRTQVTGFIVIASEVKQIPADLKTQVKKDLESARRCGNFKSKGLKSGASLMPLQRAEDAGNASKAAALKLKKRDDEIAVGDARKRRNRLRQRVPSVQFAVWCRQGRPQNQDS
jgi:hypothetical protein